MAYEKSSNFIKIMNIEGSDSKSPRMQCKIIVGKIDVMCP